MTLCIVLSLHCIHTVCLFFRYADRAKQIMCAAVVNEDPNAKVRYRLVAVTTDDLVIVSHV